MTPVPQTATRAHIPVMMNEVIAALSPQAGETYVDGTFGAGGYTTALLNTAECAVIAIDRDPNVVTTAEHIQKTYAPRFTFKAGCFGDLDRLIDEPVDGVVLDIGVSSMQIDEAERGFSFKKDGPLDMRMSQTGMSAADVVNTKSEAELADIFYHYGEERQARKIAKKIVERRTEKAFERTGDLADLIRATVPARPPVKIDPATRTFQALRIYVNDELGELERGLKAATQILKKGGRLVVVTFHSLEDGLVKRFFKANSAPLKSTNKYAKTIENNDIYALQPLTKRPVEVSKAEAGLNPRARSAKLRAAIRLSGDIQPLSPQKPPFQKKEVA